MVCFSKIKPNFGDFRRIILPGSKFDCVICKIAKTTNLCFLRIFILRFFISMNKLEFGQNDHRKDASHFSFGFQRMLCGAFWPKYEIWKILKIQNPASIDQFFKKNFNIIIFATFAIATFLRIKLCCVAIATDTQKTQLCYLRNCVFFAIVIRNFASIAIHFIIRIPTVKLKIPGKLFLKSNPELLLHSSYSFWP